MNEQQEFENYCKETGGSFLKIIIVFVIVTIGTLLLLIKCSESNSDKGAVQSADTMYRYKIWDGPVTREIFTTKDENQDE